MTATAAPPPPAKRPAEESVAVPIDGAAPAKRGFSALAAKAASVVPRKGAAQQAAAVKPTAGRAPNMGGAPAGVAGQRPPQIAQEEARRVRIRAEEAARRKEVLADVETDEERIRLERDWAAEDRLYYTIDPDDVEVEAYAVKEPFSYVQVLRNKRTHDVIYHAIEPMLSREDTRLLKFIEGTLVDVLELQPEELEDDDIETYIRRKFDQVVEDYGVKLAQDGEDEEVARGRLLYYVLRDFIGEGPMDIIMKDPMIEDISCDGPHVPMFVYHRKHESMTTTIRYRDGDHLDSFVIRMAQRAGKHISIAEPILDATMRDGSRLQATLSREVSSFGSTFTIRKFREVPFTPIDLVRFGTMNGAMLAYLWMVIQYHMSAIYAGGTASGKTTAINAIMMFIPPQQKVVTIEDTREIRVPQPNWIAGITRGGFGPRDQTGHQAGEIDMFQLLKNALRQRPEYIIVGEVRGAEAYSLFQAMATGHAAYGTMHADSVDAVIHRLESEPINIPRALLEALDVVAVQIQTRVGGKRVRRTKQITEIVGLDPNTREILTNEVFRWAPTNDQFEYTGVSYVLEHIAAEAGLTPQEIAAEMRDRTRVIQYCVDLNVKDYEKVASLVASYYKEKSKVMAFVEARRPWA